MSATKIEIGTKVFAIDGPGQSELTGARLGEVVAIEPTRWGTTARVRFDDGSVEGFGLSSIRDEVWGIGVYVAKGV